MANTAPSSPSTQTPRSMLIRVAVVGVLAGGLVGGFLGALVSGTISDKGATRTAGSVTTSKTSLTVEESSATIDTVEKVSPSVVSIILTQNLSGTTNGTSGPFDLFPFFQPQLPEGERQIGAGTGFIISADGLILTNRHVADAENVAYTVIFDDGTQHDASLVGLDPFNDLAVLRIDAQDLPVVELGDSDALKLGETVIAIGNALEYRNTVTRGVVSGINRTVTAGDSSGATEVIDEAIQTDAAINPGNSGGPLVNLAGQVVGVNTAVSQQGQTVGFAIPINVAKQVIESVREFGKIVRPYIGVRYIAVDEAVQQQEELSVDHGALITAGQGADAILPESPAENAGLKEGDVILSLNDEDITKENTLARVLRAYNVGDTVTLSIQRREETIDIDVVLEAYE